MAIKPGRAVPSQGYIFFLCTLTTITHMLAVCTPCNGANIFIFVGYGSGSRFIASMSIGKELVRRGHNVTALISNANKHLFDVEEYSMMNFAMFQHKAPLAVVKERELRPTRAAFSTKKSWMFDFLTKINDIAAEHIEDCEAILDDEKLVGRLLASEFDLAIIDQFWQCSMVVAEHVAKAHVSIMPAAWMSTIGRANGNPVNPAIMPDVNTGFGQRMTFRQRVKNLSRYLLLPLSYWLANKFTPLMRRHSICPGLYPSELYSRSKLLIANVDYAMEFPLATQPHVIPVGGLTTTPSQNLSQELEEFVQSSGDAGIVVFSLGTYVTYMKEELIGVFADAFSQMPQKVVWQFRGTPPAVLNNRPNIKTMAWLPQNDLLGHNKTRAFMYQGGNNGLYEALYHAVPIVVIPLIGDQPDVAARVKSRGMGVSLDIKTITTKKIIDGLNTVIHDKKYKETAERLSAIYHDRPMRPVETAAFWIEHVIKHGGEYMRSPILELTWYEYHSLDVAAFLIAVVVAVIVVIFYSCKFALRCCARMLFASKSKTD